MLFKATFTGRKLEAIGITYSIQTTVEADSEESARLKLYDNYDHISSLVLTIIENNKSN